MGHPHPIRAESVGENSFPGRRRGWESRDPSTALPSALRTTTSLRMTIRWEWREFEVLNDENLNH